MFKQLVAALLIVNILTCQAAFLNKGQKTHNSAFTVFNELKSIEENEFGSKLLDTIALQLQAKGPLEDIAKMLADIRLDLVKQQSDDDSALNSAEEKYAQTVETQNGVISRETARKETAEANIAVLEGEIGQLQSEIRVKEGQKEILNTRAVELDDARKRDHEAFVRRQEQAPQIIQALDVIIDRLDSIVPTEGLNAEDKNFQALNKQHLQATLAQLAKIGKSNPIAALVEVANTFSKGTLDFVKSRMKELQESISASKDHDAQEEEQAVQEYNKLKQEIATTLEQVTNSLGSLKGELARKQAQLHQNEQERDEAITNIGTAQRILAEEKERIEAHRAKYLKQKTDRAAEIDVVKKVEQIVATKLNTMQDYLKQRAEAP